jgi:tetratricopeptide (TPR) repeat protein
MKVVFLPLFSVFISFISLAQDQIDSLEAKLKLAKGRERLIVMNNLSEEYMSVNTEKSYKLAHDGLAVAEVQHDPPMIYQFANTLGYYYLHMDDDDTALEYFLLALKNVEQTEEKGDQAKILNQIGVVYLNDKKFDLSLFYLVKALKIKQDLKDERTYVPTYLNLASAYRGKQQNDKAIEYYKKAEGLATKFNNKNSLGVIYNKLSEVYKEMGSEDNATSYSQKSKDLKKQ